MDEPSAQANVASTAGQLRCRLLVAVCITFTHTACDLQQSLPRQTCHSAHVTVPELHSDLHASTLCTRSAHMLRRGD